MGTIEKLNEQLNGVHKGLVERYPDFIDRMDRCRAQLKRSLAEYTKAKGEKDAFNYLSAMLDMLMIYSYEFKALSEEEQAIYIRHRREVLESR